MSLDRWIQEAKSRLRRHRDLPNADGGGVGHEAESTSGLRAKSEQQPLQLPHVQLQFSYARTASTHGKISKAQISLQKSVEELESVLQAQLGQSSDKLETSLGACLAQGDNPQHAEPFQNILVAVKGDQSNRIQEASSRAGAAMQKMYPLMKLALGLTGTLTSSAGYAPVQIVTNGLAQVFELAMSVPKQSEEVMAGFDSMAADDYLLTELQKLPGDMLSGPIMLSAIVLQTRLVEFLRKSILWLNKTFFAKFANCVIEPTQMTDARTELRKAQEVLRSHLSVDTYLTMKWQEIATVEAGLLNSLCSNEYHTAHLLKQKQLHSTRLENSGMWAITDEKFKSWHGDAGGILWCPGLREYQPSPPRLLCAMRGLMTRSHDEAGAGKTYLASRIVDELQITGRNRSVGVAYVYCEYNRAWQQSETLVIEAMTRQLVAQSPNLCSEFESFLQNPLPTPDGRKVLLRQVLARFETTFLVLDALDEFSSEYLHRHQLACTLRDIVQDFSTGQVRLCITSREADGIWQALSTGPVPAKVLDVQSSQSDIRALVENAYDEASRDGAIQWTNGDDELQQQIVDKVVEKSDCIFKLADLQIRAILRQPSAKLAKSALGHLTKNVNVYYNEAMERIACQKETKDMIYNLLTWLTFTHSPIHLHELELALSIRPGQLLDHDLDDQRVDVLRYVSLSEGLISIKKSSLSPPDYEGPVYYELLNDGIPTKREFKGINKGAQVILAHESIREFLSDIPQPGILAKGDSFLLHCCLTIMSSPIFVGSLQSIWQELRFREDCPFSAVMNGFSVYFGDSKVEVPVFLFWAMASWGQHLRLDDLTPDMKHAIQTIHKSCAVATKGREEDGSRIYPRTGPLYWCAFEGWAEACKLLLPLEEDPNALWRLNLVGHTILGETSETCLSAAVASRDVATVQVFLDDDRIEPNVEKKGIPGNEPETPLMQACEQGNRDIVRMLLARNDINVDLCGVDNHQEQKLRQIVLGKPDIIPLFFERDDLDVNILPMERQPIHHLARIGGPPSALQLLLDNAKTDVNGRTEEEIRDKPGDESQIDRVCFCHKRTALMVAAFMGHPAQTSVLLKHPTIDPELRDSRGMTPLMLACMGYAGEGTGWPGDSRFYFGMTLTLGRLEPVQQHDETVRILLTSSNPAINERDVRGRTALIFASMGGVDPTWDGSDSIDAPGSTEWYESLSSKSFLDKDQHAKSVKALLRDDKVEINILDDMGHTALDYAMWTRDFIIQERDWKIRSLQETVESLRQHDQNSGRLKLCLEPKVDAQDIMTKAQPRIDAMSEIHDVLVASGAHSGEPIGPLAIMQDCTPNDSFFLWLLEHLLEYLINNKPFESVV